MSDQTRNGNEQPLTPIERVIAALFVVAVLVLVLFGSAGCASPSRKAISTHTAHGTTEKFIGRNDGMVERVEWNESWKDQEGGRGFFLFDDPSIGAVSVTHTNQSALGGGSTFFGTNFVIVIDTNSASVIGASGTAVGNVVGAAAKAAVK